MKLRMFVAGVLALALVGTQQQHCVRAMDDIESAEEEDAHHGHSHDGHDHGHSHGGKGAKEVAASKPVERPLHPTVPSDLLKRLDFVETFQDGPKALEKGWVASRNERYFESEWIVATNFAQKDDGSDKLEPGFANEQSLAVNVRHRHYGLTHVLSQPFDNTGKTLVFQYEVRLHDGMGCSGAYAKLLLKNEGFDALQLEEATPYVVMFGPDKCGTTNKVHFIVRQKMANNKWEEKHMSKPVSARTSDNLSHLYTLIIRSDNSFQVLVDGTEEAKGSLLSASDFTPPFGSPKEIDDPEDKKPADWVDVKQIPDPSAVKPADWDEDAPQTLPDPDATMPEGWDAEEDGEWLAPQIPNPEYKGKWSAPIIPNPEYKGEWKPRKIANPDFFEDSHPSNLAPIGAVSFEILANERGIAFDNILLTHDEAAAKEFADLTFKPKQQLERSQDEALKREKAKAERLRALNEDGVTGMAMYALGEARDFVSENLIPVAVAVALGVLTFVYWCCFMPYSGGGGSSSLGQGGLRSSSAKGEEEDEDEEEEEEDKKFSPPSSPADKSKKVEKTKEQEPKKN